MITLRWSDGAEVDVDGPVPNVGDTVEVNTGDQYERLNVTGRTYVYDEGRSWVRLDVAPVATISRRRHHLGLVATGLVASLFPSGMFWSMLVGV